MAAWPGFLMLDWAAGRATPFPAVAAGDSIGAGGRWEGPRPAKWKARRAMTATPRAARAGNRRGATRLRDRRGRLVAVGKRRCSIQGSVLVGAISFASYVEPSEMAC